jgi:LacI family transcriptional regulator
VVIPDFTHSYDQFIRSLQIKLQGTSYTTAVISTSWWPSVSQKDFLSDLLKNIDAAGYMIFYPRTILSQSDVLFVKVLKERCLPVIFLNSFLTDQQNITIDQRHGVRLVCSRLKERGFTDIAYMGPPLDSDNFFSKLRYTYFVDELKHAGLPVNKNIHFFFEHRNWKDVQKNCKAVAGHPDCKAVFCFNDYYARSAAVFYSNNNIKIPEDISLIGYDNEVVEPVQGIRLSSVDRCFDAAGNSAADMFLSMIHNPYCYTEKDITITPKLITRSSFV